MNCSVEFESYLFRVTNSYVVEFCFYAIPIWVYLLISSVRFREKQKLNRFSAFDPHWSNRTGYRFVFLSQLSARNRTGRRRGTWKVASQMCHDSLESRNGSLTPVNCPCSWFVDVQRICERFFARKIPLHIANDMRVIQITHAEYARDKIQH